VPSLKSLEEDERTRVAGFTKFAVKSAKIASIEASALRYEIAVNGTPVRIDGFTPSELVLPYDSKQGIKLDFGLQNLDFRGAKEGHDIVSLKIDLLKGTEALREFDLKLCYVALRSSPKQTIHLADGSEFEWDADYSQAKNQREYEVFIHSTKDPKDAEIRRSGLSNLAWTYIDGRRIHGVTRPSLVDNANYGVAVGLEQSTGQIQFTYDQTFADALLKWIKSKRTDAASSKLISRDSYVYRVGSRKQVQQPCKMQN
jgi:hypothetical protein